MSTDGGFKKFISLLQKGTGAAPAKKRKPKKVSDKPKTQTKSATGASKKRKSSAPGKVFVVSSGLQPLRAFGKQTDAQAFGFREREKTGKVYIINECPFEK